MTTPGFSASGSQGVWRLQPLTFAEIIGRTLAIYRQQFVLFIVLIAIVAVPVALLSTAASNSLADQITTEFSQHGIDALALSNGDPAALNALSNWLNSLANDPQQSIQTFRGLINGFVVIILVAIIGSLVQSVLVGSLLTYITSERILGRSPTLSQAFRAVRSRWGTLTFGLVLFYGLMVLVIVGLALVFFACGLGLGVIIFMAIALGSFLTPVLTLEPVSASDGLGHSWRLGKARFWTLVGFQIVAILIGLVVGFVLGEIGVLLSAHGSVTSATWIVFAFGTVATILVSPIPLIGYTVLYYDVRIRTEGLAEALQRVDRVDPRPGDVNPPLQIGVARFSGNDILNLAILTVGVFILLLAYFAVVTSLGRATTSFLR